MKNFFATLLSKLIAQKVSATLVSLSPILTGVFLAAHSYFAQYLADPTGRIGILISALAIALAPLPFASYFYFKPRIEFDKYLQIYTDVKTGIHYCPSCKDGYNRLAKLIKYGLTWQCCVKECRMFYDDPNYDPPKKDETPRTSAYE